MDDSSVQPTPLVQNVFRLLKMRDDEGLQTDISLKHGVKNLSIAYLSTHLFIVGVSVMLYSILTLIEP